MSSSKVSLLTRVSLCTGPRVPGRIRTLIVTVRMAPGARVPKEQIVGWVESPGTPVLHPAPLEAETFRICKPADRLSVTVTPSAVEGPLLTMEMV